MNNIQIYVPYINNTELVRIQDKLKNTNYKVNYFKGVNGGDINKLPKNSTIKTKGAVGHCLTFIEIIQDAIDNNYDKITIFEPDIYFCQNFDNLVNYYLGLDYKILYLGASQHNWQNVNIINNRNFYYASQTCGTFGIILDKSIFVDYISELKKFEQPSDICLFKYHEMYLNKCIVTFPNLLACDVSSSNTSGSRNQLHIIRNLKWNRKYFFCDKYEFNVKPDLLYKFSFQINSFLNLNYLEFLQNNKLIFPKLNITKNTNLDIYIYAKSSLIVLNTDNIFFNDIQYYDIQYHNFQYHNVLDNIMLCTDINILKQYYCSLKIHLNKTNKNKINKINNFNNLKNAKPIIRKLS